VANAQRHHSILPSRPRNLCGSGHRLAVIDGFGHRMLECSAHHCCVRAIFGFCPATTFGQCDQPLACNCTRSTRSWSVSNIGQQLAVSTHAKDVLKDKSCSSADKCRQLSSYILELLKSHSPGFVGWALVCGAPPDHALNAAGNARVDDLGHLKRKI
jgi:hypothetical protein